MKLGWAKLAEMPSGQRRSGPDCEIQYRRAPRPWRLQGKGSQTDFAHLSPCFPPYCTLFIIASPAIWRYRKSLRAARIISGVKIDAIHPPRQYLERSPTWAGRKPSNKWFTPWIVNSPSTQCTKMTPMEPEVISFPTLPLIGVMSAAFFRYKAAAPPICSVFTTQR